MCSTFHTAATHTSLQQSCWLKTHFGVQTRTLMQEAAEVCPPDLLQWSMQTPGILTLSSPPLPPPPSLPVCTAEWEAGFPRQGLKWGSRGPGNVSLFVLFICIKHGKAELFSFHIGYLPWSLWTRSFQNQFSLINGHFILGVWLVSQKASWWTIVFLKCSPSKPQKQKQHQRLSLTKWCCCVISLWIFLLVACHQDIDPYPVGGDVKSALCDATKSGF